MIKWLYRPRRHGNTSLNRAEWSIDHDGQLVPAPDEKTARKWAKEAGDIVYRRDSNGHWIPEGWVLRSHELRRSDG